MEEHRLPPGLLFKSFLIVSGGYVVSTIVLFVIYGGLALLFFPETAKLHSTKLTQEELLADLDVALPQTLFFAMLLLHSLACMLIGWLVTFFAPFAKTHHAIFLAVILFVGFLQMAIGAPRELQLKLVVMMGVFPIAILIGAKMLGSGKQAVDSSSNE